MNATDRSADEEWVAFADGELPPEDAERLAEAIRIDATLGDRLAALEKGRRDIRAAFDHALQAAPDERLRGILAGAIARSEATEPAVIRGRSFGARARPRWLSGVAWPQLAAAALVLFVLGGLIGGLASRHFGRAPTEIAEVKPENWRQAVAEYWVLTTPATLALVPSPDQAEQQLAAAGRGLGLDLAGAAAPPPGLSFRGAQLFEFRGRPLTQIAYLDPAHGPIAYCIITDPTDTTRPKTDEALGDFNVVHWASGGHARMLIGKAPPEVIRAYAEQFAAETG